MSMRLNYYEFPENTAPEGLKENGCKPDDRVLEGISVTTAKKMLKEHGGIAWTEHCERGAESLKLPRSNSPATTAGSSTTDTYKPIERPGTYPALSTVTKEKTCQGFFCARKL